MSQSHQEVVTLHGLPVLRKAMLVLIALTLLHQKVAFDSPTMPRAQVASFVHLWSNPRPALPRFLRRSPHAEFASCALPPRSDTRCRSPSGNVACGHPSAAPNDGGAAVARARGPLPTPTVASCPAARS